MTRKKEFTKRWAVAEEAALKAGIRKYGAGAWVRIRNDKEFRHFLERRTGTQLKDKWRNLLKFGHMTEAEGRRPAGAALDGSTTGNTNTYDVSVGQAAAGADCSYGASPAPVRDASQASDAPQVSSCCVARAVRGGGGPTAVGGLMLTMSRTPEVIKSPVGKREWPEGPITSRMACSAALCPSRGAQRAVCAARGAAAPRTGG